MRTFWNAQYTGTCPFELTTIPAAKRPCHRLESPCPGYCQPERNGAALGVRYSSRLQRKEGGPTTYTPGVYVVAYPDVHP